MAYGRLRNVVKFSIPVGLALLVIGIVLFMNSESGTHSEKLGIVFMMYSGIILGIGFTALVALKST
ncbi:MAG: hypothetical protein ACREAD_04555 [Nitrosopumilaceae archaeon]